METNILKHGNSLKGRVNFSQQILFQTHCLGFQLETSCLIESWYICGATPCWYLPFPLKLSKRKRVKPAGIYHCVSRPAIKYSKDSKAIAAAAGIYIYEAIFMHIYTWELYMTLYVNGNSEFRSNHDSVHIPMHIWLSSVNLTTCTPTLHFCNPKFWVSVCTHTYWPFYDTRRSLLKFLQPPLQWPITFILTRGRTEATKVEKRIETISFGYNCTTLLCISR